MKYDISLELLQTVFSPHITSMVYRKDNSISITTERTVGDITSSRTFPLDTNRLFFLCKLWAVSEDYEILSSIEKETVKGYSEVWLYQRMLHSNISQDEIQSVFNSTQWVIDRIKGIQND